MSKTHKIIFHIDMDAFFASCSELKNPTLRKSPVVIANHSKHAIVTTANYQARRYGIKTAMPLHQAKELCPHLQIVAPDYDFYRFTSKKIWNLLKKEFSSQLEILSIDECFLDVTEQWKKYQTPKKMALKIQQTITEQIGITASIGISYNKFLAKMATEMQKPKGITVISPTMIEEKLWPLPIEKMYGVGIATTKILKEKLRVEVIGDLLTINPYQLEKEMGRGGLTLLKHALGQGDDFVNSQENVNKSISHEVTLETEISEVQVLEDWLLVLTKNNLARLNKQDLLVKTVSVYLRYQRTNFQEEFDKLKHLKHQSKQMTLNSYTNELEIIFPLVKDCFNTLYETSKNVALIGVSFNKLKENDHYYQPKFDDPEVPPENLEINNLLLQINKRFKNKKILSADQWQKQKDNDDSQHAKDFIYREEIQKKK